MNQVYKFMMTMALLIAGTVTTFAQTKPEITISDVISLNKKKSPYKVLKDANVKEIHYHPGNDSIIFQCFFGRNVDWEYMFGSIKITVPDAVGVFFCDAGSGAWQILTDHKEWLSYYLEEARQYKFYCEYPYDEDDNNKIKPNDYEVVWNDIEDYDTGQVIGRQTMLWQYGKKEPTSCVIYIYEYDNKMLLSYTWEIP